MLRSLLLSLVLLALGVQVAQAQASASRSGASSSPERGWFWFQDPPKPQEAAPPAAAPTPAPSSEPEPAPPRPLLPAAKPPEPKEDRCKKADTWRAECGFVDPGTDFEWQSKQRDALMERMALSKNDPKAVENFQYYMRWALERTAEVTSMWQYNMAQNPDLDPSVSNPVSAFGLRLMTDVRKGQAREVFDLIRAEGGFLVYFSRHDCSFCHQMSDTYRRLSRDTGLTVRNAALDSTCMPGFEEGCMVAPATIPPAQSLQVTTVPTLFLYVQPNTWIRVATGVVDTQTMKLRIHQFFQAYRNALLTGVDNSIGARPSVNFSGTTAEGPSASGVRLGGARGQPELPSESDIRRMLGAKP